MKLLWMPQPVAEALACDWCNVPPKTQHDAECPRRDDETDYPAYCARCGVTYLTTCACSEGEDR